MQLIEQANLETMALPTGWRIVELADLLQFRNGYNADKNAYGSGCSFVNVMEIISNSHLRGHMVPGRVEVPPKLLEDFSVRKGDILFNRTSETQAELALASVLTEQVENLIFGGFVIRGRPKTDEMDATFAGYALRAASVRAQIEAKGQGVIRANIGQADLGKVRIALPPKKEQEAIAAALSEADALVGSLELLIAKKRNIKQAVMQQLLTGKTRLPGFADDWTETTMGQVGECVIGLTYRPEDTADDGLLVLRSSNIQNEQLSFADNVYVRLAVPDRLKTKEGDILICVRNGSRNLIGKSVRLTQQAADLTFGAFMCIYRTPYSRFIAHLLRSYGIQQQIRENLGATINQITNANLKSFRLHLPSPQEQVAICDVLDDIELEILALKKQAGKMRDIKQGMMQALVSGRTRLV